MAIMEYLDTKEGRQQMIDGIVSSMHDRVMSADTAEQKLQARLDKALVVAYVEWYMNDLRDFRTQESGQPGEAIADGMETVLLGAVRIVVTHILQEAGPNKVPMIVRDSLAEALKTSFLRQFQVATTELYENPAFEKISAEAEARKTPEDKAMDALLELLDKAVHRVTTKQGDD